MNRILIVEDEEAISGLIAMSLERVGYTCEAVNDGLTAADRIEQNAYDLVLLDIMLPGLDGYELLEYLRPTGTPVIFITAKGSLGDRVKGLRLGADDYIVKPFEIAELVARVESVLRRTGRGGRMLRAWDVQLDAVARTVTKAASPWGSPRASSTFWSSFCATAARRCTATPCSSACGAVRWTRTPARWTFTSTACAKSWAGTIK